MTNTETERPSSLQGDRCMCLPYNDGLIVVSAIFSAIAFLLSWGWWLSLYVSLGVMIAFQMLWCCRQTAGCLYVSALFAMICSILCFGVGVYILTEFGNHTWCTVFYLDGGGDNMDPNEYDWCFETLWSGWSFLSGSLWLVSSVFTFSFVKSGRHARIEGKHSSITATATPVVELRTVHHAEEEEPSTDSFVPIVVPTAVLETEP